MPRGDTDGLGARVGRVEKAQKETNVRLGETNRRLEKIDATLVMSSKLFELMHERLERLETGQTALVEGQKLVIERLDRLVRLAMEERTQAAERVGKLTARVERIEQHVFGEVSPER